MDLTKDKNLIKLVVYEMDIATLWRWKKAIDERIISEKTVGNRLRKLFLET